MNNDQLMNTLLQVVNTDKAYAVAELEAPQITFKIAKSANKLQVKQAVSAMFEVTVTSVNILNCKGKTRKFGKGTGRTKD